MAVFVGVNLRYKVLHLLHAVGHVGGDEVVAIAEAAVDARAESVDVFQHDGELRAHHIAGDGGAAITGGEEFRNGLRQLHIRGGSGQEGELLLRNLFGVGRSADDTQLIQRHFELRLHIVADELHGLGHDTLHRKDNLLFRKLRPLQRFQRLVQIGRRGDDDDVVRPRYRALDVCAHLHVFRIDEDGAEIFGIMAVLHDAFRHFLLPHPPVDMLQVHRDDLHNGRRPTPAANHRHPVSGAGFPAARHDC